MQLDSTVLMLLQHAVNAMWGGRHMISWPCLVIMSNTACCLPAPHTRGNAVLCCNCLPLTGRTAGLNYTQLLCWHCSRCSGSAVVSCSRPRVYQSKCMLVPRTVGAPVITLLDTSSHLG